MKESPSSLLLLYISDSDCTSPRPSICLGCMCTWVDGEKALVLEMVAARRTVMAVADLTTFMPLLNGRFEDVFSTSECFC